MSEGTPVGIKRFRMLVGAALGAAILVIAAMVQQIEQLSDRIISLELQAKSEGVRSTRLLELAQEATAAVKAVDAAQGIHLERTLRIVEKGDPRILKLEDNPALRKNLEETL